MLRSFRVANHRSIRAAQELVLLPAYDKSRPVIPVAALYGANASGKSNLLDALRWMRQAVVDSFASWTPGGGVPRVPFKLDHAATREPTELAVDLVLDGERHYYGFVVDNAGVREEWLHTFPTGRRRVIFERTGDEWTFGSTVRGPMESTRERTRPNALFLSVAAHSNVTSCERLFRWFLDDLTHADPAAEVGSDIRRAFLPDSPLRPIVLDLVRIADLGITDVVLATAHDTEPTVTPSDAVADPRWRLVNSLIEVDLLQPADVAAIGDVLMSVLSGRLLFFHGDHPVPLNVHEESAGTRTWLNLTVAIAAALAGPKILLLDEADTTLHPHLARHLVNLFRNPETNPLGAQLIFTSHDATMLDEDTLSRDEIWFVEKDPTAQTTRLYSLAEFRPRKHENTERRYLAGSYGAVPVLSETALRRAVARGTDPDAA
ncbi:ATP-binding protein [Virgisporangium ochraceum]|uniref:ATPase AAA-type core domain-containing protein n=1 Tax=Virgisporangium ochraceum TaxID=65505 RepID=A0A8J4EFZ5_9ACTN|nr:ATP-binding protein [Virgisporangium ochraceum]GIJ73359.1 hypothetical protein Voc01_082760 [Virgisporangium ochraceum]